MQGSAERIVKRHMLKIRIAQLVFYLAYMGFFSVIVLTRPPLPDILLLILVILVLGFALYMLRVYGSRQAKTIIAIIDVDCDPETFISVCQLLRSKRLYRRQITTLSLNIIHGLCMEGKYQEAAGLLREISIEKERPFTKLQYYSIYANCAEAYKDFAGVEWAFSQIRQIAETKRLSSRALKYSQGIIQIQSGVMAEFTLQYELAIETITEVLSTAKLPKLQVSASYRLARLFFLMGDYATSKTYCESVIQQGNKLYYVAKAAELLEECEEYIKNTSCFQS